MSANLPPLPRGRRMGSGVINGKLIELFMHDDAAMTSYATAALSAQAAEVEALRAALAELEALRADAETWKALYRRALNAANGLTNYVEDRPELSKIERELIAVEAAARAALKEQTPPSQQKEPTE